MIIPPFYNLSFSYIFKMRCLPNTLAEMMGTIIVFIITTSRFLVIYDGIANKWMRTLTCLSVQDVCMSLVGKLTMQE